MKSRLAKAMRYSSFCLAVLTVGAGRAQDITWVGGDSGNVNVKANWDPQWIPNSQTGDTPLIAVFTNSVTIYNDGGYWYLSGFKVRNNSAVTVKGSVSNNRIQASNVCTEFIVDVETGSSLTHMKGSASDVAFYAQKKSFRKIGGGTFKPGSRFGWSGDNPMATLTVAEGTLDASGSAIRCNGEIKVCSGATLKCGASGIVVMSGTLSFPSYVNVETGGTFDCGSVNQTLLGLEGDGAVVNGAELILTMYHSGKCFGGNIQATTLTVSNATYTAPGASWTVSAADTLKGVGTWKFSNDASVPMEVRFAAGIGTFLVGGRSYPTDRAFYDLDGMPVLIDYRHAVWYVDDDNYGKTGMDGKTPETAFGTLQEAMENPSLANYDTVFALPGTYDKGGMTSGTEATTNRVVVPYSIRLASTDGPEKTVIVGQKSTAAGKDARGNGPGAIRCVKLSLSSSISGFTLTGGRVAETDTNTSSEDGFGGGVQCAGREYVMDCIITNNAAVRAGAGRNCTFVRCRVFDNRATSNLGSAFYGATDLYGCVIDRNPCGTKYAYYSNESGNVIKNCTFGPNESCDFRTTKTTMACNTIFMSGIYSGTVGAYSNCVFLCQPGDSMRLDDCVVKSDLTTVEEKLAYAGLDAKLHPVKGSRLIDAGKDAYFVQTSSAIKQGCGATDACGAPRVSNGTIDIGGYEYDWRTDYADSLGSAKKIPIISATSSVVTNGTGGIVLGNRDVVRARCVKATGDYSVSVQVTGEGTLTVELGADDVRTVTAVDGPTELKFSVAAVPQDLRFEFAGSGSAKLVAFDYPRTGMLLLLQ